MQVLHHQETIHYSQVTKLRKQVTALTLYQLMKDAFEQSKKENCTLNFTEWRASKELESPQFQFWSVALKMEMDFFLFLQSIRSSNLKLYVASIGKFLPWILTMYTMLLHQYDMEMLTEKNPDVFQRHEQLNKDVKR